MLVWLLGDGVGSGGGGGGGPERGIAELVVHGGKDLESGGNRLLEVPLPLRC
jgi:hypothetical protein